MPAAKGSQTRKLGASRDRKKADEAAESRVKDRRGKRGPPKQSLDVRVVAFMTEHAERLGHNPETPRDDVRLLARQALICLDVADELHARIITEGEDPKMASALISASKTAASHLKALGLPGELVRSGRRNLRARASSIVKAERLPLPTPSPKNGAGGASPKERLDSIMGKAKPSPLS